MTKKTVHLLGLKKVSLLQIQEQPISLYILSILSKEEGARLPKKIPFHLLINSHNNNMRFNPLPLVHFSKKVHVPC
jgi:hypothetical protein